MSRIVASLLSALLGAGLSVAATKLWQSVRARRAWLGFVRASHVRTAFAGVFGLAASAGIALSTSAHSHKPVTYVLWYGLAALALVGVIAMTIIIERRGVPPQAKAVLDVPRAPRAGAEEAAQTPPSALMRQTTQPVIDKASRDAKSDPSRPLAPLPGSELKARLQREYAAGNALFAGVRGFANLGASLVYAPTTTNDVNEWEERVAIALKSYPQLAKRFFYEPPAPSALVAAALGGPLTEAVNPPLKRRLSKRLRQLDSIIESL